LSRLRTRERVFTCRSVELSNERLLRTLEGMLEIPAADLRVALTHATDLIAAALRAEKVDAFLYDRSRDSLVALGSSNQPLSASQKQHGLDILPLSNDGRVVWVYRTGKTHLTGRLDQDPDEILGVKETLKVRSQIGVPLAVEGEIRGVIMIASTRCDCWGEEDARFAEAIARWVGIVVRRARLVEEIERNALEQGRSVAAEELITVLAHDLRNHLAPIQFRMELLRRRADRENRPHDLRELELASRSVRRITAMIEDILDVTKIDRGVLQMQLAPVGVVAILEDLAATLSTPDATIDVRANEDVVVEADPARLQQCLENVISNAIKHSPRGGTVAILVSRSPREDGDRARIEIVDQGPGIAPEILPRIFDRFVTGAATQGGLGLGLYLAKRIAVLQGGDLTVDSTPGKGARFVLTVPCHAEAWRGRTVETQPHDGL
jgi:two-component system OmpR family sensor kinase